MMTDIDVKATRSADGKLIEITAQGTYADGTPCEATSYLRSELEHCLSQMVLDIVMKALVESARLQVIHLMRDVHGNGAADIERQPDIPAG